MRLFLIVHFDCSLNGRKHIEVTHLNATLDFIYMTIQYAFKSAVSVVVMRM